MSKLLPRVILLQIETGVLRKHKGTLNLRVSLRLSGTQKNKTPKIYAQLCIITIVSTLQICHLIICYNTILNLFSTVTFYRYKYLYKIYQFILTAPQIIYR